MIILLGFSSSSHKINIGNNYFVEFTEAINVNKENTQLITKENNGAKYFLDEKSDFLISLNQEFYFKKETK